MIIDIINWTIFGICMIPVAAFVVLFVYHTIKGYIFGFDD